MRPPTPAYVAYAGNLTPGGAALPASRGIPYTFANAAARAAASPAHVGQLGLQLDDASIWRGTGTAAGNWSSALAVDTLAPQGVTLGTGVNCRPALFIASPVVNLRTVAEHTLFTVPAGFMFLADRFDVVTVAITTPGTAPTVRFGNAVTPDAYRPEHVTTANSALARHQNDWPTNGIDAGTVVTGGVTIGSSAAAHTGILVAVGALLPKA